MDEEIFKTSDTDQVITPNSETRMSDNLDQGLGLGFGYCELIFGNQNNESIKRLSFHKIDVQ